MRVYPLFQNKAFDPERIALMASVFEDVCRELGLAARDDMLCDIIAKAILDCAQKGICDPLLLRRCVRDAL